MTAIDSRAFGAIADGATLDTAALQRAIDAAPRGVAVRLSGGTFRSGTLELHSGSILEIAPDAVLEGSPDIADYRDCGFSCGDDCFAATCITHPDGECRDILVERCRMRSRSAAIRVGHNASHVLFRDIEIADTNRGVCVYARKSGGAISDILFERLRAETRIFAGDWWGNGEPFVVSGAGAAGTIDGVTFRDCSFVCESPGLVMGEGGNVRGVALERCALRHEPGPAPSALRETMDLRPNVTLGAAPWVAGTTLFIRGAEASVRALPPPARSAGTQKERFRAFRTSPSDLPSREFDFSEAVC